MGRCEIHFTEGFTGQKLAIRLADETVLETNLQSKFQTGLAHIETLEVEDGQAITLQIEGSDAITLEADLAKAVFIVTRGDDGGVEATQQADSPGYL